MKNMFIIFALLVASSAKVAIGQNGSGESRPLARRPEVAAAIAVLDAWVASTATSREQPGLSLGIVYDQDLIWAKDMDLPTWQGKSLRRRPRCTGLRRFRNSSPPLRSCNCAMPGSCNLTTRLPNIYRGSKSRMPIPRARSSPSGIC